MSLVNLSSAWRTRLSRLVLGIAVGATIATSSSDWGVEGSDSIPFPDTIPAGGLTVEAAVHYRAPRGAWPVRISAAAPGLPDFVSVRQETVFDAEAVRVDADDPELYELRCREKECEGVISIDLVITIPQAGQAPYTDPQLADRVEVTARLLGGPEGGFVSCQRQQSSTDRTDAPSNLLFDVVIDPLDSSLYVDAGVPDAGARGSSALLPLRGLDAGHE